MSGKSDEAVEMFGKGFNCAQSVFACCGESLPMSREAALAVAGGFGGGVGSTGNICGAVSGGVMAIGMKYPRTDPDSLEVRQENIKKTQEFMARFKERNGSIECRELLGLDLSAPEQAAQARERELFKTTCPKMVRDAVEILEDILK